MKLIKYKSPQIVRGDSDVDPNYAFVYIVDTQTEVDVTSILNVALHGLKTGRDYLFIKEELLTLMIGAGGFDLLTDDEKYMIVKFGLASQAQALSITDQATYKKGLDFLLAETKKSRKNRAERARIKIGREVITGTMSYTLSNQFFKDTKYLLEDWVESGNIEFIDWINSTGVYGGSPGTGFESKPYYTESRMNILVKYIIYGDID